METRADLHALEDREAQVGAAALLGIDSAHHLGAIRNGLHANSAFCHWVPALHELVQAAQKIQDSIVSRILLFHKTGGSASYHQTRQAGISYHARRAKYVGGQYELPSW